MIIGDTAALYVLMAAVGGPAFMYLFTFVLFTRHIDRLVTRALHRQSEGPPPEQESPMCHEQSEAPASTEAALARR